MCICLFLFNLIYMNLKSLLLLLAEYADIAGLAIILAVLIFSRDRKMLENKPYFLIYFGVFFATSLFASLIPDIFKFKSNNWIYDNIPILLCIILFFYFKKIFTTAGSKKITIVAFSLLLLFYTVNWNKSIDLYPNLEFYLIFAMFVIINSVLYFLQELMNIEVSVFSKGDFWFITSVLFYASSSTLFWMFFKEIYSKYPTHFNNEYLWPVCYNTILFTSCIIFTSAIFLKTRQSH